MKKLLFLLLVIPCNLFGQYADNVLYNFMDNDFMDNVKEKVSSIKELSFMADENGKQETELFSSRVFLFNSNKQIREITWYNKKSDNVVVGSFSFEDASPNFIKQVIAEGPFVHVNESYSYTQKNTQGGTAIFRNFSKNNEPFREFVLDNNQQVIAVYEYYRGEKIERANLFEYNSGGYMVKKTRLFKGKPSAISTYKLNEHGYIIEELRFDVDHDKFDWKYVYTYTYDRYNNWITKKMVMMGFNDNGKLIIKPKAIEFYTREIKY